MVAHTHSDFFLRCSLCCCRKQNKKNKKNKIKKRGWGGLTIFSPVINKTIPLLFLCSESGTCGLQRQFERIWSAEHAEPSCALPDPQQSSPTSRSLCFKETDTTSALSKCTHRTGAWNKTCRRGTAAGLIMNCGSISVSVEVTFIRNDTCVSGKGCAFNVYIG